MGFLVILLFLAFMSGYFLAFWQYRYEKIRHLALRAEIIGMRNRIYPVEPDPRTASRCILNMPWWGKAFLGFLWCLVPEALKYNQFHIKTLKKWADKVTRPSTYITLLKDFANKQKVRKDQRNKKRGRPTVEQYLEDIIRCIKTENPGYSPGRISRMLKSDLDESIDRKTVQRILKSLGHPPNPPHKIPPLRYEPAWKAYITNQFTCGMDFKSIIDLMGNQLYILVIVHHSRSRLVHIAATYNPTTAWVAQQLREAYPYDTAPIYAAGSGYHLPACYKSDSA